MRVIRWGVALILAAVASGAGAAAGFFVGLWLNTLLLALLLAWVGFTLAGYVTFVVVGWLLGIRYAVGVLRGRSSGDDAV